MVNSNCYTLCDMSRHSISIMNLILYEIPLLFIRLQSDFSCSRRNGGDLKVKVFFGKSICVFRLSSSDFGNVANLAKKRVPPQIKAKK